MIACGGDGRAPALPPPAPARSMAHPHAGGRGRITAIPVEGAWGTLRTCGSCCWVAWPGAEKMTRGGLRSCFPGSVQQNLSILVFTSCYKLPRPEQRSKTASLVCSQPPSAVRVEHGWGREAVLAQVGSPTAGTLEIQGCMGRQEAGGTTWNQISMQAPAHALL